MATSPSEAEIVDPEAAKAEWLARLDALVEDFQAWSRASGWRTRRISKTVEKVGERLTICPPGARLDSVAKEIANIEQACTVVRELVGRLRKGANLGNIRDAHERLQSMEGDADKDLLEHLRELYHSEQDARLLPVAML